MSSWVTQREAAELLGVHVSAVPKMVRRGDLVPRNSRPSLSRADVLALRETRAVAELERERRRQTPLAGLRSPDDEHDWLLAPAAAAVLGCTQIALQGRATRGQVPYVVHGGRRWFRLDQLELVVRSKIAAQRRNTI